MMLTDAWMRLARRTLRHHRVLFRLSVVLTATWMRLARGALRFERARLAWMRLARGALQDMQLTVAKKTKNYTAETETETTKDTTAAET